jgi:serine protease Do
VLPAVMLLAVIAAACGGGGSKATPTPTAAPPTVEPTLTPNDILQKNKTSVVNIDTVDQFGSGGGSGIVWEDGTHVLTNAHVVLGTSSIKVTDPADGSHNFPAKVVALSPCDDVALLSVDRATGLTPVKIGKSSEVKAGDPVITLGFPTTISSGPYSLILTQGNVSRVHASFDFSGQRDLIQHTAPINPGNSGGPLFNLKGEVIGLNSYSARGAQSENYAIASDEAINVATQLKNGKNIDYLGITLTPNDEDLANQLDLPYVNGLVITGVDPGSPADKAKPHALDFGYEIFSVNNTEVNNVGQFCDILRSAASGATLRIQFGYWDQNGNPNDQYLYDVIVP